MNEHLDRAREAGRAWATDRGVLAENGAFAAHRCLPERYGPFMRGEIPTLHLEDVSGIPFVSVIPGVERYQHRARVRADTGDVFAAVTPISPGYEEYCREVLGLGSPGIVMADPVTEPTAVARACHEGRAFDEIVRWARQAGPTAIHPYMAIEPVWELAARLRTERIDTFVVGPTPPALWVANDKCALGQVIDTVLGEGWIVRTVTADSVDTMATAMREIAAASPYVGLKRTRCASAMGNAVHESKRILSLSNDELLGEVRRFLDHTEWDGAEEVLVVEWVDTDVSPSTQMWIPPLGAGDPVLDGIYEQLLEGPEKVFLGSRPSLLDAAIHDQLEHASLQIAAAFQAMGYVGRCSFDFIVAPGTHRVWFTECNGRWGGTSTPMFLVDRLGCRDESGRRPYHAQDFVHPDLVGAEFVDLLRALGDDVFDPRGRPTGRFVLYNVGPLTEDGKFDVISLGRTPEEAVEGVHDVLPRLLGLR